MNSKFVLYKQAVSSGVCRQNRLKYEREGTFDCKYCIPNGSVYQRKFTSYVEYFRHHADLHPHLPNEFVCYCGYQGTCTPVHLRNCSHLGVQRCGAFIKTTRGSHVCDKAFSSYESLLCHMRKHHFPADSITSPELEFVTTSVVRPSYRQFSPLSLDPQSGKPVSNYTVRWSNASCVPDSWSLHRPERSDTPFNPVMCDLDTSDEEDCSCVYPDLPKAQFRSERVVEQEFYLLPDHPLLVEFGIHLDYPLNEADFTACFQQMVAANVCSVIFANLATTIFMNAKQEWLDAGRPPQNILPQAQIGPYAKIKTKTRFSHMQISQLEERARNNSLKRTIFRCLIEETDFWHAGSKFLTLAHQHRDRVPIFHKGNNLVELQIHTDDGPVTIIANAQENDSLAWAKIHRGISAQGLFSIDHNIADGSQTFIAETTDKILDLLRSTFDSFGLALETTQITTSLVLKFVVAVRSRFDWIVCGAMLVDALILFGLPSDIVNSVVNIVHSHWNNCLAYLVSLCGNTVAQSDFSLESLISVVLLICGAGLFKQVPSGSVLSGLVAGVKVCGDVSRGMKCSWSFFSDLVKSCLSKLFEWKYGVPADVQELAKYSADIIQWYTDVLDLLKLSVNADLKKDPQLCVRIESSYRRGLEISRGIRHQSIPREHMAGFIQHMSFVRDLYKRASSSGAFSSATRVEPVMVYLFGDSGVGKSGLTTMLAAQLCMIDGLPTTDTGEYDYAREIYTRNVTQEFWDDYSGQRVCVYDDFGQRVDSVSNPNAEYDEIIRTGNITSFPLHMAHLEDKDNTRFTSRVVIMTSNLSPDRLQIPSLSCDQAVLRRLENCYEVTIDPAVTRYETINGTRHARLDPDKVQEHYGSPLATGFYRFRKWNASVRAPVPEDPIVFETLVTRLTAAYKRKSDSYRGQNQWIQDACRARVSEVLPVIPPGTVPLSIPPPRVPLRFPIPIDADRTTSPVEFYDTEDLDYDLNFAGFESPAQAQSGELTVNIVVLNKILQENGPACVYRWDIDSSMLLPAANTIHLAFTTAVDEEDVEGIRKCRDDWSNLETYVNPGKRDLAVKCDILRQVLISRQGFTGARPFYLKDLFVYACEFKNWIADLVKRSTELVRAHWWWFTPLCAVAGLAWAFLRGKQETETELPDPIPYVTCMHEDIFNDVGDRQSVLHAHTCDFCGKTGTHSHCLIDRAYYVSTPILCEDCQDVKIKVEFTDEQQNILLSRDGIKRNVRRTNAWLMYLLYLDSIQDNKIPIRVTSNISQLVANHLSDDQNSPAAVMMNFSNLPSAPSFIGITRYYGPTVPQNSASSSGSSGDPRTLRRSRKTHVQYALRGDELTPTSAQIADDPNSLEMAKKVLKNTYKISVEHEGSTFTVRTIFLCGRVSITVMHLGPHLKKPGAVVRLTNYHQKGGYIIPAESIKLHEVLTADGNFTDQMILEFPKSVLSHPSLISMVADTATLNTFKEVRAALCTSEDDHTSTIRTGDVLARDKLEYDCNGIRLTLRTAYEYRGLQNSFGDCGSPLIAMNSAVQRKLLGFHVAGHYGTGYSTCFNIDNIKTVLKRITPAAQIKFDPFTTLEHLNYVDCGEGDDLEMPCGDFFPLGLVEKPIGVPLNSKLRPSLVHGMIEELTTAPSALRRFRNSDGVLVDPLEKGLMKAGTTPPYLDESLLYAAVESVKTAVNGCSSEEYRRVLTDDESLRGLGDNFAAICRTTSPGYPWVLNAKGTPGKSKWLGKDEDFHIDPEVTAAMQTRVDAALRGERTPAIFVDTLKDERRPLEKVAEGKTRVFAAGPMDFTLLFRKYFGGFTAHVVKNRITNEISVGTDPLDPAQWGQTAEKVLSKGPKVIAGDFSNFDGTLLPQILEGALDVIEDYYRGTDEEVKIRYMLWREIVNSIHLKGRTLYMWTHSQPSGCPITAIVNSLFNSISMRYVWLLVVPVPLQNMRHFVDNVSMVSYGDDNLIGISDAVSQHFNQITITAGYAQISMVYTNESKTGEIVAFRDISEVKYLKRGFTKDPTGTYWLAPLEQAVCAEMPNWVRGDLDHSDLTCLNLEGALYELFFHGRDVFDHYRTLFTTAARRASIAPILLTYEEMERDWAYRYGLNLSNPDTIRGAHVRSPRALSSKSPVDAERCGLCLLISSGCECDSLLAD